MSTFYNPALSNGRVKVLATQDATLNVDVLQYMDALCHASRDASAKPLDVAAFIARFGVKTALKFAAAACAHKTIQAIVRNHKNDIDNDVQSDPYFASVLSDAISVLVDPVYPD